MGRRSDGYRRIAWLLGLTGLVSLAGCAPRYGPQAQNGITFYCPGAGNIDFGDEGIRRGLEQAGYRGQVVSVVWTISFNPAIDQVLRINARVGAARLARCIEDYIDKYPGRPVNIVGLSAGTGVAIWALENLKSPKDGRKYEVDNVILLSSSLHYRYDASKALKRVKGRIYNYYSSQDAILAGPMKLFGTIDGVFGVDGAGAVGLQPPRPTDKIVNIEWKPEYRNYGYHGGHTDATSPRFVQHELARHLLSTRGAATAPRLEPRTELASPLATAIPDAR